MAEELTEKQRVHREVFNDRTQPLEKVDLDFYSDPRFSPGCPYWTTYQMVKSRAVAGAKLLIVGCGNGRDGVLYASLGYQVEGIDIADRAVQYAQQLADKSGVDPKPHFSVQAAESTDFPDDWFDGAVGVNVLHHVDVERAVREVHRVLRPGGWAIFKEPRLTPIRDRVRRSPPVSWILPEGVKDKSVGVGYLDLVEGERNLDGHDLQRIRDTFGNLSILRFHFLAKFASLIGRRRSLERWDARLFRWVPPSRWLGDQMVLEVTKT